MKYSNCIQDYSTGSQGPVLKKRQGWKTNIPLLSWTLCRSTVTPHIHIPHPVLPQRQKCEASSLHLFSVLVFLLLSQMTTTTTAANRSSSGHVLLHLPTESFAQSLLPYIPAPITQGSIQKKTLCPPCLFGKVWAGIWGINSEICQIICQCGMFNKSME